MSDTINFLERVNSEFERSFAIASEIANEMGCYDESLKGAKRVFNYNPNSEFILDLFPQFAPIIEGITKLVGEYGNKLKEDSKNPDIWTTLGCCYLTLGDFPNAFALYSHAKRVLPDQTDPNFWYAMGIVYGHYKYIDHSRDAFVKVIQTSPGFVYINDINFRLGILYRSKGQYDHSIVYFQKAIQYSPNGLTAQDVLMQIAYTHQLNRNPTQAQEIYQSINAEYPNSQPFLQQYCLFLFLQSNGTDFSQLYPYLSHALSLYPNDITLLLIAARIAMRCDDIATAYEHFKYCIDFCNDSSSFWCGLGVLYYRNDQIDDASVAFQKAININNGSIEGMLNFGLTYERRGDFATAQKIYSMGQQQFPDKTVFNERINTLMAFQRPGNRKQQMCHQLVDIDDSKFIPSATEMFSNDYLAAVPKLPLECFGIGDEAQKFHQLSTYPKSFFK
ncbi:TPR Domain containing protein [Histomonas meleagridis]|uniref:TPR Domain containing protein n=1 Tax=Histomonas meleagridis TaxID=135588 RepID=UPI00355A7245|nr:TPR Domain containing protein [Histomonas meleagridis]KAH0801413.1 TPR Domain containing protein [Histomonas meleagridis]